MIRWQKSFLSFQCDNFTCDVHCKTSACYTSHTSRHVLSCDVRLLAMQSEGKLPVFRISTLPLLHQPLGSIGMSHVQILPRQGGKGGASTFLAGGAESLHSFMFEAAWLWGSVLQIRSRLAGTAAASRSAARRSARLPALGGLLGSWNAFP